MKACAGVVDLAKLGIDDEIYTLKFGGPAASIQYTVSLVQWVNRMLPAQGSSGSRPGDAPTLTMELGSPGSDVLLKLSTIFAMTPLSQT